MNIQHWNLLNCFCLIGIYGCINGLKGQGWFEFNKNSVRGITRFSHSVWFSLVNGIDPVSVHPLMGGFLSSKSGVIKAGRKEKDEDDRNK
jgi:hypothetical protein